MLVRFDTKSGTITMFGDVALKLLRLMGQSGAVPGAILGQDIPAAVERLRSGLQRELAATRGSKPEDEDGEPQVGLAQRAAPLIELLDRAGTRGDDVIWKPETRVVL